MHIISRLAAVLATLVLALVIGWVWDVVEARRGGSLVQFHNDFRTDSTIVNAASALQVVKNAENDYSLKVISGDATKNVTLIRFAGSSAEADITVVYTLFKAQGEVLGLEW